MFSVQEVDTYTKFKLQEGNLYMNNQRVGIEEFHGGKNIDICNHMFRLKDDLDISGNIIVDEDMIVKGTILQMRSIWLILKSKMLELPIWKILIFLPNIYCPMN